MKIRLGMVGGGPGAFIGGVHRMAAALDGRFDLVAGAFSSDPAKSASMGAELGLDSSRAYACSRLAISRISFQYLESSDSGRISE